MPRFEFTVFMSVIAHNEEAARESIDYALGLPGSYLPPNKEFRGQVSDAPVVLLEERDEYLDESEENSEE